MAWNGDDFFVLLSPITIFLLACPETTTSTRTLGRGWLGRQGDLDGDIAMLAREVMLTELREPIEGGRGSSSRRSSSGGGDSSRHCKFALVQVEKKSLSMPVLIVP